MDSVFDGTSNTIMVGEMHIPTESINLPPLNGPVFEGQELAYHTRIGGPGVPLLSGADEAGDLLGFGSPHPGITNFVFADGSAESIGIYIDSVVLGKLCNRGDGQNIDDR